MKVGNIWKGRDTEMVEENTTRVPLLRWSLPIIVFPVVLQLALDTLRTAEVSSISPGTIKSTVDRSMAEFELLLSQLRPLVDDPWRRLK